MSHIADLSIGEIVEDERRLVASGTVAPSVLRLIGRARERGFVFTIVGDEIEIVPCADDETRDPEVLAARLLARMLLFVIDDAPTIS